MSIPTKEDLVKKVGDLKVLPFVARKLLETISDENVSIDELTAIIEKDQTIAARVLKISNSAIYGLRHEVTSLQQAIMVLGFKTIRSLVLSVSTKSLHKKFGMTEKMIWDHSVGAAIAAKMISADLGSEIRDIAFIGGLMHDMGKVFMNNETPEEFSEVMMKIYNDGVESIAVEEEFYGYNHSEIGSKVIAKWGLSPVLVKILEMHHLNNTSLEAIGDSLIAQGTACVNLADYICKVLGIGYREPDDSILLKELPSAVFLKLNNDKMDALVVDVRETYESEKTVFA
jgi:putative nucleotidyltransferase with HDIG domain